MVSRECALWAWFKKARKEVPDLHMCRIENAVMSGMPDVEGHWKGCGQFWLELKSAARPKKSDTPIRFKIRDAQIAWLNRRWSLGGYAYWLIQVGSGFDRTIYLVPGLHGWSLQKGVTETRLSELACAAFSKHCSQKDILVRLFQCSNLSYRLVS